jgi:hypothetical protein
LRQRAGLTSVCPGNICNPGLIGVVADPSVMAIFDPSQKLQWFATMRGRIEVAKELLRVLSVTDELAKTNWPDPDLRHCQQDME